MNLLGASTVAEQERVLCFFQSAPVPVWLHVHSINSDLNCNKAQRRTLDFKAVTVILEVHLGISLGGKD